MTDVVLPTSAKVWEDQQQKLAVAKDAIVGEVPTIADTPETMITLPRGIPLNGKWHARAEVRELTGADEEALAKVRKPEETFDVMLSRGVVRIGELDISKSEGRGWLSQLLIGEREILFLAIAKATYGDERTVPVTCQNCDLKLTLNFSISEDFKPKETPDLRERTFTYKSSKGQEIEYRLATGNDQNQVLKRENATVAEMNTVLLSNCITSVDGNIVVDPMYFARSLPMRDRQAILSDMVDHQPSVDLTIKFPCDGCGEGQQVNFSWLDFFRP